MMNNAHRLCSVPAADLATILGPFEDDWVTAVPSVVVTDATGAKLTDCVFADLLTGFVVRKVSDGLRAENRKAPLTKGG